MKRMLCVLMTFLLLCSSLAISAQADGLYHLGDTVEDFTLTDSDGQTISLSGLLADHRAVLIIFWFAGCGPCRYTFPILQSAYETYGTDVAVLAVTPYDSDREIRRYKAAQELTFPMARDTAGITDRFVDYGFPTSVLIDRAGVLCYAECGAQTNAEAVNQLLTLYIGEEYSGPLLLGAIPEPVTRMRPESVSLDEALNVPGGALSFTCGGGDWPWIVGTDGSCAMAANMGVNSSTAWVETAVTAQAGDVLSFRCRTSCEEGYDALIVQVDGRTVKALSGENDWRSCAVAFEEAGDHTVAFLYSKNELYAAGEDTAALDDVCLLTGDEAREALAQLPQYPLTLEGQNGDMAFMDMDARQIVIDDPEGVVEAYYGADAYYILPADRRMMLIRLGDGCDPDSAFLRDINGYVHCLSHCDVGEEGFLFYAPAPNEVLGWNALILNPSLEDAYGEHASICMYFESEEAVDAFCLWQVIDPATGEPVENVTWDYKE